MSASGSLHLKFDERAVDTIFSALDQCHLPGVAVGIAHGGVPIYRKGFGLANQELPILLSPSIRMRIGSTSKHFTCLAYLLLCERGLASLEDPIRKYLPQLHAVADEVTVRQLMGHVGGLRDSKDIVLHLTGTGVAVSSAEIVQMYSRMEDRNFAPGNSWQYNNGGYQLISAAIERIADASLEEFLRREIFESAGLRDTLLRRVDTDFVPNSAALHIKNRCFDSASVYAESMSYRKRLQGVASAGEGGIVSTVDDMLRWLSLMNTSALFSTGLWNQLTMPFVLKNGASTGYGLGLMIQNYRGTQIICHGGTVRGGNSQMLKVPELDLNIVVIANRDDISSMLLAEQLLDVCVDGLKPISDAPVNCVEQTFLSSVTDQTVQFIGRDGRQIAVVDGTPIVLEPRAKGGYQTAGSSRHIRQTFRLLGDSQCPHALELSNFGSTEILPAAGQFSNPNPQQIYGRYVLSSLGIELLIDETHEGLCMMTRTPFGSVEYRLTAIAQQVWTAHPVHEVDLGAVVTLTDNGSGLQLSTFRNRALEFRRFRD